MASPKSVDSLAELQQFNARQQKAADGIGLCVIRRRCSGIVTYWLDPTNLTFGGHT